MIIANLIISIISCGLSISYLVLNILSMNKEVNPWNNIITGIILVVISLMLLIVNFIGLLLQFSCGIVSYAYDVIPIFLSNIIFRAFSIYFVVWVNIIFLYLLEVSIEMNSIKRKLFYFVVIIESVISLILPYQFYSAPESGIYYTYGLAINYTYVISMIICTIMFILMQFKHKVIWQK